VHVTFDEETFVEAIELFEVEIREDDTLGRPGRGIAPPLPTSIALDVLGRAHRRGYHVDPVSIRCSSSEMRLVAIRWRTSRAYSSDIILEQPNCDLGTVAQFFFTSGGA
jgi:hypothetical protein